MYHYAETGRTMPEDFKQALDTIRYAIPS
ncbi:hypothetical protein FT666_10510 [Providencia rettgeri]|nr:hypothetical protein CEQ08_17525 [Providencia rettgeri]EKH6495901.1 type I toxin-antitoxin system ptaRNA1 family toxin [Providencia rettgeri]ELR5052950.1 type I toxin-antitoxin system ptaRNA1 family toxin [Providencia rettgeri]ELR5153884.1 type I toxin-antitoxin system ptaRNA1 family toxin [Providencia rettgeri]ELR5182500.1 type I toxin-antitoxin system ptaRNA1 family toxin [Providencia rettgeri]